VLASRLSEEPDLNVLLIEAGPDAAAPGREHDDICNQFGLYAHRNRVLVWPDLRVCIDRGDGRREWTPYAQGLGVGGSSNINGMGVDRGQPDDFDEWFESGISDWGWNRVLPYFKKLETELDLRHPAACESHGHDGPMPVRRLPRSKWAPFTAAVGKGLEELGFAFLGDYTSDFHDGFAAAPNNSLPGTRVSAAMAYLTAMVRARSNLTILADAKVARVTFEGRRASGVQLRQENKEVTVRAEEVILAGGAIQSPALLMRSGLGEGAVLRKLGVDVIADLPAVGRGLQNHQHVTVAAYLAREAWQAQDNHWLIQSWLRFSSGHAGCSPGDMQLITFNRTGRDALGQRVGGVSVSVLQSFSRGSVRLVDRGGELVPEARFNLFEDRRDFERLESAVRFTLELLRHPAVEKMHREVFIPTAGMVSRHDRGRLGERSRAAVIGRLLDRQVIRRMVLARARVDAELLLKDGRSLSQFISEHAQVQYHPTGTCRMGRRADPDSVVDHIGRVHGTDGLRVIDASIFPTIPRGNPHFIVLMTAEKLADSVKQQWRSKRQA
jgi:5-(hydroxymethyl)furfural/furfural oxidase